MDWNLQKAKEYLSSDYYVVGIIYYLLKAYLPTFRDCFELYIIINYASN